MTEESILQYFAKELPMAGVMSFFCWAMLQIVKQVMVHYQKMIDEQLVHLANTIKELASHCDRCPNNTYCNHEDK